MTTDPPDPAATLHVGGPNIGDRARFHELVDEIFDRRWLTNSGPLVEELEERLADYLQVDYCVAMTNGTIALEIAIRALDLSGEVIVPSYTFVATAHALNWQAIRPVFADINPDTHNLNPDSVMKMITPETTGIVGVHLWGRPADCEALQEIAEEHELALMFDASHAFGSAHQGQRVGSFGQAEVFSFHATKFFNTFEGGAVATNDQELAEKMRLMRNFGFAGFDKVVHPGTNGKMSEICAAMGLVNLDSVDEFITANRDNFAAYKKVADSHDGMRLLEPFSGDESNYQYVVVELLGENSPLRDKVVAELSDAGVMARRYFWPGVHRMEPYASLDPHADLLLPQTKIVADRTLVLPTGTATSPEKAEDIMRMVAGLISSS